MIWKLWLIYLILNHLHTLYGTISNHPITGNMNYKEWFVNTDDNFMCNYYEESKK